MESKEAEEGRGGIGGTPDNSGEKEAQYGGVRHGTFSNFIRGSKKSWGL
jgi:hypothetical protein